MPSTQPINRLDLSHAAKVLGIGPMKLSNQLHALGIFKAKADGRRVAAPEYVEQGYFVNKIASFDKRLPGHGYKTEYYEKVLVTEKGINLIREKLKLI